MAMRGRGKHTGRSVELDGDTARGDLLGLGGDRDVLEGNALRESVSDLELSHFCDVCRLDVNL